MKNINWDALVVQIKEWQKDCAMVCPFGRAMKLIISQSEYCESQEEIIKDLTEKLQSLKEGRGDNPN